MKRVLDACCGARASWFQPDYACAEFVDMRYGEYTLCDGRSYCVHPDTVADFRMLPYKDELFDLVFFDPPHLLHAGENSWLRAKYGALHPETWRDDLRAGFSECLRVLRAGGTLVFKWCEEQVALHDVLALAPCKPLFGGRRGRKTHFVVFYKPRKGVQA